MTPSVNSYPALMIQQDYLSRLSSFSFKKNEATSYYEPLENPVQQELFSSQTLNLICPKPFLERGREKNAKNLDMQRISFIRLNVGQESLSIRPSALWKWVQNSELSESAYQRQVEYFFDKIKDHTSEELFDCFSQFAHQQGIFDLSQTIFCHLLNDALAFPLRLSVKIDQDTDVSVLRYWLIEGEKIIFRDYLIYKQLQISNQETAEIEVIPSSFWLASETELSATSAGQYTVTMKSLGLVFASEPDRAIFERACSKEHSLLGEISSLLRITPQVDLKLKDLLERHLIQNSSLEEAMILYRNCFSELLTEIGDEYKHREDQEYCMPNLPSSLTQGVKKEAPGSSMKKSS